MRRNDGDGTMSDEALRALATRAGLDVDWLNYRNEPRTVSPETLRAVLKALGLSAHSPREIVESHERLDSQVHHAAPLLTAWAGETVRAGDHMIKAPDTPGYCKIEVGGEEKTLAVAPHRCFDFTDLDEKRFAGLGVQLYGLRGGHTDGFGDFAALGDFAVKAAKRGIDAIGLSPVHALFAAAPSHISPYSPSSRLFLNPLYADPALAGGKAAKDDGAKGLVDWETAAKAKFAALRRTYRGFLRSGNTGEFHAFCASGGERLHLHAVFEALHAQFWAKDIWFWRNWPQAYRDAKSAQVAEFARTHRDEIDYHLFLQFLAAKSASTAQKRATGAGMAIGLIADIATGIDPSGSDAWSNPDDVLMGLSVGAPPDLLNQIGQGWGLTALSPTGLKANGFEPFIALLRASMAYAGAIRIDHAMSLMRLWVIPEGASPTEGAYLRYPMDDLLRLTALESQAHRAIVIGEDLGTVPEGFRARLGRRSLSGMQVLWFERDAGGYFLPQHWRDDAVALTTTHDLPTVCGWWRGRDIEWRTRLNMYPPGMDPESDWRERERDRHLLWSAMRHVDCVEGDPPSPDQPERALNGALSYVGMTPPRLAITPIEDVLALDEAPNLPGTVHEHPNWRRRLPPGDPFAVPGAEERIKRFVTARKKR